MTLDEIKAYFGNSYQFSKMTGMRHSNYVAWKIKGYIPILSQNRIEQLTNGQLKADFKHAEKKYNVEQS